MAFPGLVVRFAQHTRPGRGRGWDCLMADYDSNIHMPRRKRVILWLLESPTGRIIWGWPLIILAMSPMHWLGIWWLVWCISVALSFTFGWNAARRHIIKTGRLPKI